MRRRNQSGFALLLVFLMAAIIGITLYMEIPRVAFDTQRQKELLSKGNTAVRSFDQAQAQLRSGQAQLDQANAELKVAQDQLSYTELRADAHVTFAVSPPGTQVWIERPESPRRELGVAPLPPQTLPLPFSNAKQEPL